MAGRVIIAAVAIAANRIFTDFILSPRAHLRLNEYYLQLVVPRTSKPDADTFVTLREASILVEVAPQASKATS
jgi:hypothetical protein